MPPRNTGRISHTPPPITGRGPSRETHIYPGPRFSGRSVAVSGPSGVSGGVGVGPGLHRLPGDRTAVSEKFAWLSEKPCSSDPRLCDRCVHHSESDVGRFFEVEGYPPVFLVAGHHAAASVLSR